MSKALTKTDFHFPGQKSVYHGKVRDVYNINDEKLIMVATDRISAFDVVFQLETRHSRPDGDRGRDVPGIPRGNDCTRIFVRKRMACLQERCA